MPSTIRVFSEDVPQVLAALTLESRSENNGAAWTTERDRLALEEPGIAGAAGVEAAIEVRRSSESAAIQRFTSSSIRGKKSIRRRMSSDNLTLVV